MSNSNGGPAFPRAYGGHPDPAPGDADMQSQEGMELRDYFAAKALQGICAHQDTWGLQMKQIAESAYEAADAMLAARSQP